MGLSLGSKWEYGLALQDKVGRSLDIMLLEHRSSLRVTPPCPKTVVEFDRWRTKKHEELLNLGLALWDKDSNLYLLPASWCRQLPKGLELTSIDGARVVVGRDRIECDHRFGYLAYGLLLNKGVD